MRMQSITDLAAVAKREVRSLAFDAEPETVRQAMRHVQKRNQLVRFFLLFKTQDSSQE